MDNSYALGNISRDAANATSDDAAIMKMEQQAGLRDSNGNDISDNADAALAQHHQAIAAQITPLIEKQAQPKKLDPLGGDPEADKNNIIVQAEGGVVGAIQSMTNAGIEAARFAATSLGFPHAIDPSTKATFADDWFPESDLMENKIVRGATQFLTGFAPLAAGAKALGMVGEVGNLSKTGSALAGAATNFLAFDKDQTLLGHLAQDIPDLANPMAELAAMPFREAGKVLAGKPEDSPVVMRIKNTLDGLGMGVMTHYVWKGLTSLFAKKVASEGIAALEHTKNAEVAPPALTSEPPASDGTAIGGELTQTPPAPVDLQATVPPPDVSLEKKGTTQLNLERVQAADSTKAQMAQTAKMTESSIVNRLEPSLTHNELKMVSENSGITPEQLLSKKAGEHLTDEELHAARNYNVAFSNIFVELRDKALQTGNEVDAAKAMQAFHDSANMNAIVTQGSNARGKSLNYLSMPVKEEEAVKFAHNYLSLQDKSTVADFLKQSAKMPKEALDTIQRKSLTRRLGSALTETYVGNLLYGPWTHITNFTSNALNMAYTNLETAIASRLPGSKMVDPEKLRATFANREALLAKDTSQMTYAELFDHQNAIKNADAQIMRAHNSAVTVGEATTTAEASAKEFAERTLNTLSSITDTFKALKGSAQVMEGKTLSQLAQEPHPPFSEYHLTPAITSENLGFQNPSNKIQQWTNNGIDMWGNLQRLGASGLDKADMFQKWVNYRGAIHAKATRFANLQNLVGPERDAFITNFLNHPPENMTMEAGNEATYKTWTNPLQTEFAQNIDKAMKSQILGVQPLRFFWPFTKTPGNIAQFALDRSLLALLSQNFKEAMIEGGAKKQMALARLALGNTVVGSAAVLAGQGFITGSGPANPKMRKLMEDAGWQPNAIKLGDTYIPIKKFAPVGDMVGMGADGATLAKIAYQKTLNSLLHIAGHMGEVGHAIGSEVPPEDAGNLAGLMTWMLVNHSTPEMLVDTMGNVVDAIQSRDISKIVPKEIAAAVPFTGPANVARRALDPNRRVIDPDPNSDMSPLIQTAFNAVKEKIPGWSSSLPARQNLWGKDVQYPPAFGPDFVSPFIGSKFDGKDPVISELTRLGYVGPATNVKAKSGETWLDIAMPSKTITQGPMFSPTRASAQLDPFQYHRYVQLSAGEGLQGAPVDGKNLKEALTELMKSPDYKQGTDQYQRLVIKKYVSGYKKAAKAQLLDEYPDLQQKLNSSMQAKSEALGGQE